MIEMGVWEYIIIEGFCGFSLHKDKSNHGKSKRPEWCQRKYKGNRERVPQERCLYTGKDDKMCQFFGYGECQKEVMMLLNQVYDAFVDKCHDDESEPDKKKVAALLMHIKSFECSIKSDKK